MGRKITRSELWWELLAKPTDVRCEAHYKSGSRCRREAIAGGNVCGQHGGSIPAVRAKAAARIGNAADEMVKRLHAMLDDPSVDAREKVKIAQDMLDRAGLNATEKLLVGMGEVDTVERLFRDLLSDPSNLAPTAPATSDRQFEDYNRVALEAYGGDEDDSPVVVGEVVATYQGTPPHIRKALREFGL